MLRKNTGRAALALGAATVGMLAAGPLASADTLTDDNGNVGSGNVAGLSDLDAAGIVNAADNNGSVPLSGCNNYIPGNALGGQLNDVALAGAGLTEGLNGAVAGEGAIHEACDQHVALADMG